MSDKIVYRSTHPDVLAAWAQTNADRRAWHARMDAWVVANRPGVRLPLITSGALSGDRLVGFEQFDGDADTPPDGWRATDVVGRPALLPNGRTRAGKALARAIDDLGSWQFPGLPGMQAEVLGAGRIFTHGVSRIDDTLYVTWGGDAEPEVDGALWERCPLSVYYAAVEAAEAAPA